MIRFGYTRRDQLPKTPSKTKGLRRVAVTILQDLNDPLSERDEAAIEAIGNLIEAGHDRGQTRRSFRKRYKEIDRSIVEELEKRFAHNERIRILDVAASNAITSLELFEALSHLKNFTLHATDLTHEFRVVSVPGSRWRVAFDNLGRPLQFVGYGLVIDAHREERQRYVINQLLARFLKSKILPAAKDCLSADNGVEKISAFHPRAVELARTEPRFTLGQGDIFEPSDGSFKMIRAMCVLNTLPDSQVRKALQAICGSLVNSGLLVVGNNPGKAASAPTTIFERRGNRLTVVRDLVGGTEKRELILNTELNKPAPDS